jgi:hypothetical protein
MPKASRETDLEKNLKKILRASQQKGAVAAGVAQWEIGKHTLTFLQKNKALKYRDARDILKQRTLIAKKENEFLRLLEKHLGEKVDFLQIFYIRGRDPFEEIGIRPIREMRDVAPDLYPRLIRDKAHPVSLAYKEMIGLIDGNARAQEIPYRWLNAEFESGRLEEKIRRYQQSVLDKKAKKFSVPKEILNKIALKRADEIERLPEFATEELDVLHVAFCKAQGMNDEEKAILLAIDPTANTKNSNDISVVVNRAEALNMCYPQGSDDGRRRKSFAAGAESLRNKTVKWVFYTRDGKPYTFEKQILGIGLISERIDPENKFFYFTLPRIFFNLMEEGKLGYFKTRENERLINHKIPPQLTVIQDRFILQLKAVAPICKDSISDFKWDAEEWATKLWNRESTHLARNVKTLFEFGQKQVQTNFLKMFEKVEENGKIFAHFIFQ